VSKKEYNPGIIGPFALQATFVPGPPKEQAITFDISLRVQGSPGTKFTPYSGYLWREEMSVGRRIAIEIKSAIEQERVEEIVT
jgi:5-formaminoimidazole-4-carboxamide-1-(beta)-D-ribofuranosyl 5'-monophosphate synthetase